MWICISLTLTFFMHPSGCFHHKEGLWKGRERSTVGCSTTHIAWPESTWNGGNVEWKEQLQGIVWTCRTSQEACWSCKAKGASHTKRPCWVCRQTQGTWHWDDAATLHSLVSVLLLELRFRRQNKRREIDIFITLPLTYLSNLIWILKNARALE